MIIINSGVSKWVLNGLFALLLGALFTLLQGTSANASSQWDNVINPVDRVFAGNSDITGYLQQFTNDDNGNSCGSFATSYNIAETSGSVAVISWNPQNQWYEDGYNTRSFIVWTETVESLDWTLSGNTFAAVPRTVSGIMMFYKYNNEVNCMDGNGWMSSIANYQNGANWIRPYSSTYTPNYPVDYEGINVPESENPASKEELKPNYSYVIEKDGKLKLKYLTSTPKFLTGISFINIDKMNADWTDVTTADLFEMRDIAPAGWLDETYTLTEHGYYMIRITHNQQLDSPPWPEDASNKYYINNVVIQFYWDGTEVIRGITVDCEGSVCNTQRTELEVGKGMFEGLGVPVFGLQDIMLAPINFMMTLPSLVDTCTPIGYTIMGKNLQINCLSPTFESKFGVVVNIWRTVITALVGYLIAVNIFATVKNINRPDDDSIEVVKL